MKGEGFEIELPLWVWYVMSRVEQEMRSFGGISVLGELGKEACISCLALSVLFLCLSRHGQLLSSLLTPNVRRVRYKNVIFASIVGCWSSEQRGI